MPTCMRDSPAHIHIGRSSLALKRSVDVSLCAHGTSNNTSLSSGFFWQYVAFWELLYEEDKLVIRLLGLLGYFPLSDLLVCQTHVLTSRALALLYKPFCCVCITDARRKPYSVCFHTQQKGFQENGSVGKSVCLSQTLYHVAFISWDLPFQLMAMASHSLNKVMVILRCPSPTAPNIFFRK